MAAGQFIRFGNFAHTLKRGKKASAQAVIAEALRQPGSSDHVARNYGQVLEPRVFRGSEQSVLSAIEISTATRTNAVGHRIRRDSPVLCGVIASYPRRINPAKRGEMDFFDDAEEMRNYEWWRQRALAWFDDIYGSRLRLVVEHLDESNPHLHALLVPKPFEPFSTVNPATWGGKTQINKGVGRRVQDKQCIALFQESFYASVSRPSGHERGGGANSRKRTVSRQHKQNEPQKNMSVAVVSGMGEAGCQVEELGSIQKWMLEHIRQKGIKRILDEIHACCREQGIRAPDPDAIIASIQTDLVLALG